MTQRHNLNYSPLALTNPDLDKLRLSYKAAIDEWVDAIRAEEALATPNHSITAMEHWDSADFKEPEVHAQATEAGKAFMLHLKQFKGGPCSCVGFHTRPPAVLLLNFCSSRRQKSLEFK